MNFFTVKSESIVEITEKKSVFIGHSFFVDSEKEAIERIEDVKNKHTQADHNVYAYSLRDFGIQKCSDNGEPQGTAGSPVLKVINSNSLINTLIVVTRYFGGILLGAGGLVRAYTKAAAAAVEKSGKSELITIVEFSLEYGYDLHNNILRALDEYGAVVNDRQFTEKIIISATLPENNYELLKRDFLKRYYTNILITEKGKFISRS